MHIEITQPMQMRFNELITGIRQDVAIKVFGTDLDVLSAKANEIAKYIEKVEGVGEPFIEKVTGLPQIQVEYNREQLARYGLSISDVNMVLRTAFAGNVAGVVFEQDRRFDMVVRLQKDLRQDVESIRNLFVTLPSGNRIPLNQVADISYKTAPAQISHEEGQRRIYVGFNVRGRDVESTVEEIHRVLDEKLTLPPGYYYTYGGQFQNLQEAKDRLMFAVPAALFLIFILLFFTFRNVKLSLLIFTAIPLSAIGGIFALWLRDMPFSISAGIGFIALFGVAVLNGIVLIGQFKQLKEEGMEDIYQRVRLGTTTRLRPVLMTSLVASLGFLPMALSTSAGSEVQKPLATVVIGGLISATMLTLLILPALYILFNSKINLKSIKMKWAKPTKLTVLLLLLTITGFAAGSAQAQSNGKTLSQCIETALNNNLQLKAAGFEVEKAKALQGTAFNPEKTSVEYSQDPITADLIDKKIGITQTFEFPTVYTSRGKMLKQQTILSEKSQLIAQNEIVKDVSEAYYNTLEALQTVKLLQQQDSIYADFLQRATVRYTTGESNSLEKMNAESRYQANRLQLNAANTTLLSNQLVLKKLLNTTEAVLPLESEWRALQAVLPPDTTSVSQHPLLGYYDQQMSVNTAQANVEKNKLLPDLFGGYYFSDAKVPSFQVGISVPLFFGSQRAEIKAAKIKGIQIDTERQNTLQSLQNAYAVGYNEYIKAQQSLAYYETTGVKQADEIIKISNAAYKIGEIGYMEYIQNLQTAIDIKINHVNAVNRFNQSIILLNFLKGNQ